MWTAFHSARRSPVILLRELRYFNSMTIPLVLTETTPLDFATLPNDDASRALCYISKSHISRAWVISICQERVKALSGRTL